MVLAGPAIASRVEGGLHQTSVAPLPSAIETRAPQLPDETPTKPSVPPAPTMADVKVTKIQTVPAMSDVVVDVGGRLAVTDRHGAIGLGPDEAEATVRFIGPAADPTIQTVDLATWNDGSTDLERSLTTIDGPVAEIGLIVKNLVIVEMEDPGSPETIATFRTQLGNVDVQVGEISWVAETVTIVTPDGLAPRTLTYTIVALSSAGVPAGQTFRPTTEATWRITT